MASQITGRRMMLSSLSQTPPWPLRAAVARRPTNGTGSALTRSPSRLITAGSSVSVFASVVTTTSIAPTPMLIVMSVGDDDHTEHGETTVIPLKKMARLAVAPVAAMASILSRPRRVLRGSG